ncbi:hypothetical protein D4M24_11770 [Escherichia coli]|nr:hypothetical protein D4M24_11770 [Escherichia coli]
MESIVALPDTGRNQGNICVLTMTDDEMLMDKVRQATAVLFWPSHPGGMG